MEFKLIMIVDDDVDDRFFLETAIHKINDNISCLHAINGEDGIKQLKALTILPKFIFLDLNMPVMNGKEFLSLLKSDENLKHIPVIIYTTSVSSEDMKFTSELGAAYYLPKTADLEKLPAKVSFAIDMINRLAHGAPQMK